MPSNRRLDLTLIAAIIVAYVLGMVLNSHALLVVAGLLSLVYAGRYLFSWLRQIVRRLF